MPCQGEAPFAGSPTNKEMTASPRITAQDFYDHEKCPHRVYLNRYGDPNKRLPNPDFLDLLFSRALLHEQAVISGLPFVSPTGETLDERADSTIRLMSAGADRIYQGVLLYAKESGIPDIMEKVDGNSSLGGFFYKPVDIKSGSGFENEQKGTLREDYGLQLFHYATLMERVQGTFPPEGEILNRRGQRLRYELKQFADAYNRQLPVIRSLVEGKVADEPARCPDCGLCQWWGHCEQVLIAANDVSLLPDVGRSRRASLRAVGVRTVAEVGDFDFSATKIKGIGEKTAQALVSNSKAQVSGQVIVLAKLAVADAPVKIYFDFEDDPTQELVYLCGLWVEPAVKDLNYHGFFCVDEAGEAKMWVTFQEFCHELRDRDYVVFHYSFYEKTKLAQLEQKYGLQHVDAVGLFRSRMVDLHSVVKASVALPVRGYGLKHVAPLAGHTYSVENAGGAQAIVWFQRYQAQPSDSKIIKTLLEYNKEDCLAMKAICEWLRKL